RSRGSERKLDRRKVVADDEQVELAAAERRSIRSVAGQRERLEHERPGLQSSAGDERSVYTRRTGDLDSACGCPLGYRLVAALTKPGRRRLADSRNRIR